MPDITQAQADAVPAAALPLHSAEGTVIGAIGVSASTSTAENDHTVASAGAAARR